MSSSLWHNNFSQTPGAVVKPGVLPLAQHKGHVVQVSNPLRTLTFPDKMCSIAGEESNASAGQETQIPFFTVNHTESATSVSSILFQVQKRRAELTACTIRLLPPTSCPGL